MPPAVPRERVCDSCSEPFLSHRDDARFCSKTCSRRERRHYRERARRAGVAYEPIHKSKVFARDGWRCGICRRKVNPRLAYPHPKSASLDHVIPISLGGPHLYSNVQLAHLDCNVAKSAGGSGEQLALLG